MSLIYHITTVSEWKAAQTKGAYQAASLASEGFIHCSKEEQVAGVLQRYYKDRTDLVKLTIDTAKLKSQLIYEWSKSTEDTFPHVYGPINTDAVVEVTTV